MIDRRIINLQRQKVNQLCNEFFNSKYKDLTFKAPTGSGKTIMMGMFMQEVLSKQPYTVFIVSSLSKIGLAKQNHESFVEHANMFPLLNPYLISTDQSVEGKIWIPIDANVYSLPRDLNKKDSNLKKTLPIFFEQLKNEGKQIVLIRDESHIKTSNIDDFNSYFQKTVNFSATPLTSQPVNVEITEQEAEGINLIKFVNTEGTGDLSEFESALKLQKQLKKKYEELVNINPCMIVQISNMKDGEDEWEFIKSVLEKPENDLQWVYMENNVNNFETNTKLKNYPKNVWKEKWPKELRSNLSTVDVIVFKMVISEGWDIPRASSFFQVRDTKSGILKEQVLGRVRRNPLINDFEKYENSQEIQSLISSAYLWGERDRSRNFKNVHRINNDIKVKTTRLKELTKVHNDYDFDILEFAQKNASEEHKSIFDLYQKWLKVSNDTYETSWDNISTYDDWFKISSCLEKIEAENDKMLKNYEDTMVVGDTEELAENSYFELTGLPAYIDENEHWAWEVEPNVDDRNYFFDSDSERDFVNEILMKANPKEWARNYYANSKISFEYINGTEKKSYPDFVAETDDERVHIFEVKSLNKSSDKNINEEEYVEKIYELAEAYKQASLVTDQDFYIPIKKFSDWDIKMFVKGKEKTISKEELISKLKEQNKK